MYDPFLFSKHLPRALCLVYHAPVSVTQTCWFPTMNSRLFILTFKFLYRGTKSAPRNTSEYDFSQSQNQQTVRCCPWIPCPFGSFTFWHILFFAFGAFYDVSIRQDPTHAVPRHWTIGAFVWCFVGFCIKLSVLLTLFLRWSLIWMFGFCSCSYN